MPLYTKLVCITMIVKTNLVSEHFAMVSEDGDYELDGLHSDLEFFVQGHGDDAVL